MDTHVITNLAIFLGIFLSAAALLHSVSKKYALPYTVILFLVGFAVQVFNLGQYIGLHGQLSTDFIFFILLPLLLFESALHINFHQFRLQFKTITFVSTIGLLISVLLIGVTLPLLIGIPLPVALLFGAVISATDPVAVLALFKTLPVPHRLSLLVDGESMFNDGTGVIVFKLVSTLVLGSIAFKANDVIGSVAQFGYVFVGAMVLGVIIGFVTTELLARVENDRVVETTITLVAALGSFIVAEHVLHVSGVIATVMTGIFIGNLRDTRISTEVGHFIEDFWDYAAFIANSAVFFFIGYIFNVSQLLTKPLTIVATILVVLIARSASVYVSYAITNRLSIFRSEPNVPLVWQHIINWGGLRGTVPIVLVFTIPEAYIYKDIVVTLTLVSVMFTLVVNGSTTAWLLKRLGLHLPKKEEAIITDEKKIFAIQKAQIALEELQIATIDPSILTSVSQSLKKDELELRDNLLAVATQDEFLRSLKIQGLKIERDCLQQILRDGLISEDAYYDFLSELDLQQDFVEYNNFTEETGTYGNGKVDTHKSFRRRLSKLRHQRHTLPILGTLFQNSERNLILDRYLLLGARIKTSQEVLMHLDRISKIITKPELISMIEKFRKEHMAFIAHNEKEASLIMSKYSNILREHQNNHVQKVISSYLAS